MERTERERPNGCRQRGNSESEIQSMHELSEAGGIAALASAMDCIDGVS